MTGLDDDVLFAAVDLIGRAGAKNFQVGYLHDDVPVDQAGWHAHAQYRGTRIIVENQTGPVEAAEALAERILTGALCIHCGGLIALTDAGAIVHPGAMMADGSIMTEERARSLHHCRYRRIGAKWVRGCDPEHQPPRMKARKPKKPKKGKKR